MPLQLEEGAGTTTIGVLGSLYNVKIFAAT